MSQHQQRVYFPGLNGIRAIAATIVVLFHTDQYMKLFNVKGLGYHQTGMAGFGVVLFFVLSGYLITFLLLKEKERFGFIDFKKFYIRRILRIWPIYYLAIIIGLILIYTIPGLTYPAGEMGKTTFLFCFLLANVAYAWGLRMTPITPLWSVGVEEQFYAFWPWIVSKVKNVFYAMFAVIGCYLLVKFGVRAFQTYQQDSPLYKLITFSAFDCMAIGGIGAGLVFHKKEDLLRIIQKWWLQAIAWSFLVISIFWKPIHVVSILDQEMHALFYLIIIINVSTNPKTLISLEYRLFDFLGKISYGMYVYHMIVLSLLSAFLPGVLAHVNGRMNKIGLVTVLTLGITILVSWLSYYYFESYFLSRKHKFAKVNSTNSRESLQQEQHSTVLLPDILEQPDRKHMPS